MTNLLKFAVLAAVLGGVLVAEAAHALPVNRCVRLIQDPQTRRETIVNVCTTCMVAKVARQRPGSASGTPTLRDFTLLPGNRLMLPFRGPGQTRITEAPCKQAP